MAIRLQPRDEQTFPPPPSADEKWKYYIQTYQLVPPTEGVPIARCKKVFLRRNMPTEQQLKDLLAPYVRENMEVRICVNTYRMFFQHSTDDVIMRPTAPANETVREKRKSIWKEKLPTLGWRKDADEEEVKRREKEWDQLIAGTEKDEEGDVDMKES